MTKQPIEAKNHWKSWLHRCQQQSFSVLAFMAGACLVCGALDLSFALRFQLRLRGGNSPSWQSCEPLVLALFGSIRGECCVEKDTIPSFTFAFALVLGGVGDGLACCFAMHSSCGVLV